MKQTQMRQMLLLQSNIDTAVANATDAITNNAVAIATTQADVGSK